ncbi:MAG: hypothetical protein ABR525_09390, partial [Candidatus Limnocylindria bacterium]
GAAALASGMSVAVIMLPLLPPDLLAATPIPAIYPETAEQIGWPELVASVETVAEGLPPRDRERAAVLTLNYGEAGALTLFGGPAMPPVYSGHNSFVDWGPPDDGRDLVILVGWRVPAAVADAVGPCERRATIRNPAGVRNEELGAGVWVCPQMRMRWSDAWKRLRHLN